MCHARVEVVHTIGRRRVHDAGAVAVGGVVGQVHGRQALVAMAAVFARHAVQRVPELQPVQLFASSGGQHCALQAIAQQAAFHQRLGQHQQAARCVHQRIDDFRVQVQRLVGRQGPGSGGPDDHKGVLVQLRQAKRSRQARRVVCLKGDVQRLALLVLVFDFKLGQRAAAVKAPVHGLEAPVDKTALDHALESAQFTGLVREIHGLVRVVPIAQDAQALEVCHLLTDLLCGVGAASGLHFIARELAAMLLFNRVLNWQAMAFPARDVQGVKAFQLARLDNHVLQNLVDRMAHVDLAIGIGRTVVQDELRMAAARCTQALVQAFVVPFLHPAGLALGQIAAHREGGLRQVQRAAVVRGDRGRRRSWGGAVGEGVGHGGWWLNRERRLHQALPERRGRQLAVRKGSGLVTGPWFWLCSGAMAGWPRNRRSNSVARGLAQGLGVA